MNYTEQELAEVRKIQAVLISIKKGTPLFFNIIRYQKMGLVNNGVAVYGKNGSVIDHKYSLTPKAEQFLNIVI